MARSSSSGTPAAKAAGAISLIAGLWLIAAPFVLGHSGIGRAMWNDVLTGIIVVLLAIVSLAARPRNEVLSWLNYLPGVWLLIAPFLLMYGNNAATANDMLVGIVIVGTAAWSAKRSRFVPDPGHAGHTRATVGERAGED
jgi:hypothetical protein